MSTFGDTLAGITAHNHEIVSQATWGHLAPKKNTTYRGHVVFAVGCFGSDLLNPTTLECELSGLDSSPWFYDALHKFLGTLEFEEGGVYRWEGTFRNYKFKGAARRLTLV